MKRSKEGRFSYQLICAKGYCACAKYGEKGRGRSMNGEGEGYRRNGKLFKAPVRVDSWFRYLFFKFCICGVFIL